MAVATEKKIGLKRSGAIAALAVSLAAVVLPAAAQARPDDEDGPRNWGRRGGGEMAAPQAQPQAAPQGDWGNRGGGGWSQRVEAAPVPQVQQQAPRAERNWSGNSGGGWGERRGGWNGGGQVQQAAPPVTAAPPPVQQQRDWGNRGGGWGGRGEARPAPTWQGNTNPQPRVENRSGWNGGGNWGERNRTYSDPNRNPTYTDRRDNGGDRWRNNGNRGDWNRDNRNWSGGDRNRDGGERWRGDSYRSGRQGYAGNYRSWNHDWRRDNRYNWSGWRSNHRDVFRMGSYYAPYRNYSYRRLSAGFFLDSLFYSSSYWINDPWSYRLPEAYGPYRWVRYYDDALLVDVYSGEVVDVIYDFFW